MVSFTRVAIAVDAGPDRRDVELVIRRFLSPGTFQEEWCHACGRDRGAHKFTPCQSRGLSHHQVSLGENAARCARIDQLCLSSLESGESTARGGFAELSRIEYNAPQARVGAGWMRGLFLHYGDQMAHWNGVFPAITTQMLEDGSLNVEGTAKHAEALIESGVTGIIFLGSLGENQTLAPNEKRSMIEAMVKVVSGRVHVLSGVAESSTQSAIDYIRYVEKVGGDGVMLMPPMLYRGAADESLRFFQQVTRNTGLPIMVYNNPIAYFNDITPSMFERLAEEPRLVAIKESSGDTRRITDLRIAVGDRYALFTGVDNLILEASILGIDGWVAGSGIAFPKENQYFWELTRLGRWEEAREMYRWFTPLLHLDVHTKFVQYIKLMVQECGLGREWVRAPRLSLTGEERERILKVIHQGIQTRPNLRPLSKA